jgi:hypothetical protein
MSPETPPAINFSPKYNVALEASFSEIKYRVSTFGFSALYNNNSYALGVPRINFT